MTITLPIYVILILMILGAALGYAVRAGQRLKMRKLIDELEETAHAGNSRILELEQETLHLETRLKEWQIPVIPLKKTTGQPGENVSPKITVPDINLRKQLLRKNDDRQSASR